MLSLLSFISLHSDVTTETFDVCVRAAASWIRAADFALSSAVASSSIPGGDSGNNNDDSDDSHIKSTAATAFSLSRPPGHHATTGSSNGFCLFNFAATAALHVVNKYQGMKVSILDYDIHYGQGTADIVLKHPNIRYVSTHQVPAFPYMGETNNVLGTYENVMTIPIPPETTWGKFSVMKGLVIKFMIDLDHAHSSRLQHTNTHILSRMQRITKISTTKRLDSFVKKKNGNQI